MRNTEETTAVSQKVTAANKDFKALE